MLRRMALLWLSAFLGVLLIYQLAEQGLNLERQDSPSADMRAVTQSGCFGRSSLGIDNKWSLPKCTFGSTQNRLGTVLVLGDSTAASLSDGAISAGDDMGLSIVVFPSRGCPFAMRQPYTYTWCVNYLEDSLELATDLKPRAIIISNYLSRMDIEDRRIPFPDGDLPQSKDERLQSAVQSVQDALIRLHDMFPTTPILYVHEIPLIPLFQQPTLLRRVPKLSIHRNSPSFQRQMIYIRSVEARSERFSRITFLNPSSLFCGRVSCSAVSTDGRVLYMDSYHLNPEGSAVLAGSIKFFLRTFVLNSDATE